MNGIVLVHKIKNFLCFILPQFSLKVPSPEMVLYVANYTYNDVPHPW
jgi:hypothetical protein